MQRERERPREVRNVGCGGLIPVQDGFTSEVGMIVEVNLFF